MAERQYSDAEVAAIFERAAKTEHTALPISGEGDGEGEGKGLTLAALQEIGREVGLSPEAISQAARSLDHGGRPASRTFLGLPIAVGQTVEFDQPLTESDWERLVADLRDTFQARGSLRYDGPFRQWTNGNLQALVEPTATGHRLRLQTMKGDSRALMAGGGAMVGVAAVTTLVVGFAGGDASGVGLMALLGVGLFVIGALRIPGWARRRRAQIEEIIARLAIAAKPR